MDAILSFQNARHAIAAERLLLAADERVRVMPLPSDLAAGCGICLRLPPERREAAAAILERGGAPFAGMHLSVGDGFRPFPPPLFSRAIGLVPGDVVAIVGCGGKTTLANRLAMENRHLPVLFSTTTRILEPPDSVTDRPSPDGEALLPGVTLACERADGKLRGLPLPRLERLRPPGGVTIVEADGSRGLPLKGWADHEPVIPDFTTLTLGVCSLAPLGKPFSDEIAHRPGLFRELARVRPGETIGVGHIAAMVGVMFRRAVGRRVVFINRVESPEGEENARRLAALLPGTRVAAGRAADGVVAAVTEGE